VSAPQARPHFPKQGDVIRCANNDAELLVLSPSQYNAGPGGQFLIACETVESAPGNAWALPIGGAANRFALANRLLTVSLIDGFEIIGSVGTDVFARISAHAALLITPEAPCSVRKV
jgi:hypothetical protein